jgi:acetyl-CoA carboxylase biotin carboxyl carrier protein
MNHKEILEIVNGFTQSGLAELELSAQDISLKLHRYPTAQAVSAPACASPPPPVPSGHQVAAASGHAAATPSASGAKTEIITSPIVASFYRSPSPDTPSYCEIGQTVKTGQPLCVLEAMKVMNELTAEFDCEILSIIPKNGDLVEYGAPLFEVTRA